MGLKSMELTGLRILVTGAGSGLGRQMARGLSEAGADLLLCGRRLDALETTAEGLPGQSGSVECISVDVTSESDVGNLPHVAGRVDVLVNNAGISRIQPWDSISMDEWRGLMALNVDAPFRLCQLFLPGMVERGWGRIINIGSVYGTVSGDPRNYSDKSWDLPGYIVSKHALVGLTKYLATTFADQGICANLISPGMFPTEANRHRLTSGSIENLSAATPMRRMGADDDLQAAAVFLASPGAKFVTGQNLIVDGGWTLW